MHQINTNGEPTALVEAINVIRAEQVSKGMGAGYIFTGTSWLWGGVWWAPFPPLGMEWYVVVPPLGMGAPYFHYGIDSLCHPDVNEYVKWIKTLNLW